MAECAMQHTNVLVRGDKSHSLKHIKGHFGQIKPLTLLLVDDPL